jgi:acyl carrier protein
MTSEITAMAQNVRAFVVENYLFSRPDSLRDEDSFLESGIIDSTGILELVTFLENTYGIKVKDDELVPENLDSINNISAYLTSKLGVAGVAAMAGSRDTEPSAS